MTMTVSDQYDALSDLSDTERQQLVHWEKQFTGTIRTIFLSSTTLPLYPTITWSFSRCWVKIYEMAKIIFITFVFVYLSLRRQ